MRRATSPPLAEDGAQQLLFRRSTGSRPWASPAHQNVVVPDAGADADDPRIVLIQRKAGEGRLLQPPSTSSEFEDRGARTTKLGPEEITREQSPTSSEHGRCATWTIRGSSRIGAKASWHNDILVAR